MLARIFGRKARKPLFPTTYAVHCSCSGEWGHDTDWLTVSRARIQHNVDRMNPYICDGRIVKIAY